MSRAEAPASVFLKRPAKGLAAGLGSRPPFIAALFICVSQPAAAQSRGVRVPVWAGSAEADLTLASLTATVGGSPAKILQVCAPKDDLLLLLVLDLTDDLAAVEQARRTLIDRINALPPNHIVGVMTAQNGLRVLIEPTSDHQAVINAIQSQQVGGRAGLLETVEKAAELGTAISAKSGVRVAVFYITDSDIGNYREAFTNPTINQSDGGDVSRRFSDTLIRERISRMLATLAATDAPVFVSHLVYKNDSANVAYQTGLLALTKATGGNATFSRSVSEIPAGIEATLDRIVGHYSVTVSLPASAKKKADVILKSKQTNDLTYRSTFVLRPE
ncbi:MAG: hypothetical protein ABI824_16620 [Acidobacteriota bacterium]